MTNIDNEIQEAEWKLQGRCVGCGWKQFRQQAYQEIIMLDSRTLEFVGREKFKTVCVHCERTVNDD